MLSENTLFYIIKNKKIKNNFLLLNKVSCFLLFFLRIENGSKK